MSTTHPSNSTCYLVTGVAGNLGSSVARELLARGQRVRGLVLPGDPAAQALPQAVERCEGDVTNADSVGRFISGAAAENVIVIHCAAVVTVNAGYSQKVHDVNVDGTRNVVDACLSHDVRKLVHVSSTGAIPEQPKGTPITEVDHFDPDAVVDGTSATRRSTRRRASGGTGEPAGLLRQQRGVLPHRHRHPLRRRHRGLRRLGAADRGCGMSDHGAEPLPRRGIVARSVTFAMRSKSTSP